MPTGGLMVAGDSPAAAAVTSIRRSRLCGGGVGEDGDPVVQQHVVGQRESAQAGLGTRKQRDAGRSGDRIDLENEFVDLVVEGAGQLGSADEPDAPAGLGL